MARYAFTRAQRIRKRPDFVRIQESGARVSTRHLLLLLAARSDEGPARLGVVASRKVGGSVVRNRAKRLLRDAFRRHPDVFPAGLDVVVIIRPGTHELACAQVDAEIRGVASLLQRRASALRNTSSPRPNPGPSPAEPARPSRSSRHREPE